MTPIQLSFELDMQQLIRLAREDTNHHNRPVLDFGSSELKDVQLPRKLLVLQYLLLHR